MNGHVRILRLRVPPPLVLVMIGAFLVRLVVVFATPPLFAPDEGPHLLYVHAVATGFHFPVDSLEEHRLQNAWANEFYQPPLFYLLAAPVYRLLQPFGAAPVYGVRFVNVGLSMLVIFVIYLTARRLFPDHPWTARLAAALAAFLPTFVGNSASVNNDLLANLLVALATYLMVTALSSGELRRGDTIWLSVVVALALYTKSSAIVLVPAVLLWAWLLRRQRLPGLRAALAVLLTALVAVMPWWVFRNLTYYGNLLGGVAWASSSDPLVERLALTLQLIGWSFWVAFGRIYEVRASLPFTLVPWLLVLVAIVRVKRAWSSPGRLTARQRGALLLLLFITLWTTVGVVKFLGLDYGQGQGRYLFPALPGIAILVAFGLADLVDRGPQWVPRLLTAALAAYCAAVLGIFVLPAYRHVVVVQDVCGPTLAYQAGDYYSWVSDRRIPSHGSRSNEGSAAVCGTRAGSSQ